MKNPTLEKLLNRHCKPVKGEPMTDQDIGRHVEVIGNGWRYEADRPAIVKSYAFDDFHETIEFVNAVAWVIHGEDHHPDMAVGYDRCELAFSTHSVAGLSINDFICAAKCDAVRQLRPTSAPA
ncbi:4a-hydroxytetrahydrobiopterin dehydratase [soil metagenome]